MGVAMAVTCLYRICRKHGTITAYIEIIVNKLNRKLVKAKLFLHLYLFVVSEKVQFPSRPSGVLLCNCERWSNNPT